MKKVINGKRYNTDSATLVAEWWNGLANTDFYHCYEDLYRKRTGEFFLHGIGGPMSKYAVSTGQNEMSGGEKIIPLTIKEAKKWAEKNLDAEEYEGIFEIDEEESNIQYGILLPESLYNNIKNDAENKDTTMKNVIVNILKNHYKGENKMKNIEELENYIANYNESGNAIDPILGMNKNDVQSLKATHENGDLFLYDSKAYSEYINDSIEEYASDESLVSDFKDKLDEFKNSNSRFVIEDTDGNVYFVK